MKTIRFITCAAAVLAWGSVLRADQVATTQPASSVEVPASIEAFWVAELNAKTSGYVSAVKADIGDHVTEKQVLAEIHVPELDNSLAKANAMLKARTKMLKAAEAAVGQARGALGVAEKQLESYRAESNLQQITLKRQEELAAGKAATPQQLDDARGKAAVALANVGMAEAKTAAAQADVQAAEANRDVAAAQVDVARAEVDEARTLLDYTKITAPFDGVITRRLVNPGDLVQAATSSRTAPLFTIQRIDTVRIFCDVPELSAAGIAAGSAADVKIYGLGGKVLPAKVTRISGAINPASRNMRVEIDLKNEGESLRPGMYAQVRLSPQSSAALERLTQAP